MRTYVDSSVILAILLDEEGSSRNADVLRGTNSRVMSSLLLEAEVFAVANREKIDKENVRGALAQISMFSPERVLAEEYDTIFRHGYLRGADAYHLACALFLDPKAKELKFLTLDKKQRAVARKIGFRT